MNQDKTSTVIFFNGEPCSGDKVAAVHRCRVALEDLDETDNPSIKHCNACDQQVFKVVDFEGFQRAIAARGCVWGEARTDERPESLNHYLGGPHHPYEVPSGTLTWDD